MALGVTREDAEQEDSDRFWSEHALGTKFERWCWEHEPLIRHLQENPEWSQSWKPGSRLQPEAHDRGQMESAPES